MQDCLVVGGRGHTEQGEDQIDSNLSVNLIPISNIWYRASLII